MAVKPSTFAGPTGSPACLGLHPSAFRTSGRAYGLLGRAVQKVLEGCSPKQCLAWVSSVVPTAYATKKSPHKRAPSSWFWHLHAVASSLQKVFREGAPLWGDAGGIVPVGSKGAALRVGLYRAPASRFCGCPQQPHAPAYVRLHCLLRLPSSSVLPLSEPSSKDYVIRVTGGQSGTGVTHRPKKQVFGILEV